VAVRQPFTGYFSGRALLIFLRSDNLALVRIMVNDDFSLAELIEVERDVLAKTGNIILNGCLGSMDNMLRHPLTMSLPEVIYGNGNRVLEIDRDARGMAEMALFLYISFLIQHRDIHGYIAMVVDLPSIASLKQLIAALIAGTTDGDSGS
jgi:chemotaxis protein CheC